MKIPFEEGDHILGIFHKENEVEYALSFLKEGLEKNEAVVLITDKISKKELREKIKTEWGLKDFDSLLDNRHFIFKTPQQLLFPNGKFLPNERPQMWDELAALAIFNGKTGVRIFVDTSPMFKNKLDDEVFKKETSLPSKLNIPCTITCAYTHEDSESLGKDKLQEIKNHHNKVFIEK